MVVCHCRAVNDRAIRAAILSGAREPDEVARQCGAGDRCGGCLPALRALLDQADLCLGGSMQTVAAAS